MRALSDTHPAILEERTIFPSTVVTAGNGSRALVSGVNNRKIGRVITKGKFQGYALYVLTLAERTTCPRHCEMYATCYGNAMSFAIRHRPGPELEVQIELELADLMVEHSKGVMVRLHGLGDFYSPEYVEFWGRMLRQHKRLSVYGYTAHSLVAADSKAIVMALAKLMNEFGERIMIRLSGTSGPMGAVVINRKPESANVPEGLVCPAEREATACCATCALCWSPGAVDTTIVFVRHGMGSRKGDALRNSIAAVDDEGLRPVRPVADFAKVAVTPKDEPPRLIWVDPQTLLIDESYQRSISRNGLALISRIVRGWNWASFKPPIVCETPQGLFIIDGQHTSIAAASHPDIEQIPVMVVTAETLTDRAKAFLGHNRDRVSLTQGQIYRSAVVAGDPQSLAIQKLCEETGVEILSMPPSSGSYVTGQTMALGAIKALLAKQGPFLAKRTLMILMAAETAPIRADHVKALAEALDAADVAESIPDAVWINVLNAQSYESYLNEARALVSSTGESTWRGLAALYLAAARNGSALDAGGEGVDGAGSEEGGDDGDGDDPPREDEADRKEVLA